MFNVRPRYSVNNPPNKSLVNIENCCDFPLRKSVFRKFKYFLNVSLLKFRKRMLGSINKVSGHYFISHVFFLRSRVKMIWVNAFPIVAFVKDIGRFANFTPIQTPRSSMGEDNLPGCACNSTQMEHSIPRGGIDCSGPIPACSRFLNFGKESFYIFNFRNHHQLMMTHREI